MFWAILASGLIIVAVVGAVREVWRDGYRRTRVR